MAGDGFVLSFAGPVAILVVSLLALSAYAFSPLSRRSPWVSRRFRHMLASLLLVVAICAGAALAGAWNNLTERVHDGTFSQIQMHNRLLGWSLYLFVMFVPVATVLTGAVWAVIVIVQGRLSKV
jgi:hypothetical protein